MQLIAYGQNRTASGLRLHKLFLRMKLLTILMVIGCMQLYASGYSQTINLSVKNHPLDRVLNAIGDQSGYFFFYKYNEIQDAKPVTLNLKNVPLEKALQESLKGQPFTYTIDQKTIVITRLKTVPVQEPVAQVAVETKGTVTGENGEPLAGATVQLKGTSQMKVTDAKGNFSFDDLQANAVLIVSYTGYEEQEVSVAGKTTVTIRMRVATQSLNSIVVVGYGTQLRKEVTGSISTINSQKIKDQPVVSVDQAMAAQMAGVQVTQTTGAPGGGAAVRIRGAGSLSAGNEPLYVIDGFPVTNDYDQRNNPLNTINPADIESIQVLKDASATAIYGSRGSNGVVIITTKSGKSGTTRMNLTVTTGVQTVEKLIDVLNAREFANYINQSRNNAWVNSGAGRSATDPNSARLNNVMYLLPASLSNPDSLGEGTNWQREIFRPAYTQNYQFNISGGNDKTNYFISAGYLNQQGIILNSDLKRYSFRINVETKLRDNVKVGANLMPAYTFTNLVTAEGNWQGGGIIQSAITAGPHLKPYDANGNYTKITGQGIGTSEVDNPVKLAREGMNKLGSLRLLGTAFAEFSIAKQFTFKALVGTDIRNNRQDVFSPSIVNPNSVNDTKIPTGSSSTFESKNWLSEFTLNYNRTFNRHKVQGLLGYTIQKEYIDNNTINGTNFPNDIIRTMNAAGLITSANSTKEEWSLLSYLARVNYSFDDKYLVTAAFRQDGSSRFGADNRWGFFPSFSLGWRLSEENFLKNVSWITDLKLRASYGLTGNNFISNYGHIGLTIADNYVFGNSGGSVNNGIRLNNIPNSGLGWEKNRQIDAGFELAAFGNRLTFIADYYNKRTSDLLLSVPVPTLTGYANALQNIGEIENRGFEFTLISRNTVGKFKWTTDLNFSTNQIKVMGLGPDGSPIIARQATSASAPTHITQIGAAPGSYFGYQVIGVYQNDADVAKGPSIINANGTTQSKPGHLKFRDVNGDGVISSDDRTILGNPFPDFTYGITNTFSYGNFDFAFTLQGVQGVEVLNLARRYYGNYAGLYNVLRSTTNGWMSETSPGDGITPMIDRNFNTSAGSTVINNVTSNFVEDGSFLRIRNITLGYNLPQSALRTLRLSSARFSFTVQNAYTFTKYEGYNPEVSAQGGSPLVPGTDAGGYPLARSFNLGINIGF